MDGDDQTPQWTGDQILGAYRMASQNKDTDAMNELHGMLLKHYQSQDVNPAQDMQPAERFVAGMGHAFQRGGEGLANLVGLKGKLGPFDSTDEGLKNEDQTSKALLATTGGKAGDIAGQVAETLPLGMGTGAALRGARALLPEVAAEAGNLTPKAKVLYNALKAATAGGENALQSAAFADPDKQASEAGSGFVLGAALNKLGQVGGRAVRGLVEKSRGAQELEDAANAQDKDLFIPISQGAADGGISGATKAVYQHVLPYAIGVEKRLGGQSEEAKSVLRDTLAEMQRPERLTEDGQLIRPSVRPGATAEETAANLSDAQAKDLGKYFDTYKFNVPFSFRDQVVNNLKQAHPDLPEPMLEQLANTADERMQIFSKDGVISGSNLRDAMNSTQDALGRMGKDYKPTYQDTTMQGFRDLIDDHVKDAQDIVNTTKSLKDKQAAQEFLDNMSNYKALAAKDPNIAAITRATEGAAPVRGAYEFKDAARQFDRGTDERKLAQTAHELLEQESPGTVNPSGRHLFHTATLLSSPFLGFGHSAVPAAGFIAGANLAATKKAQQGLYGDLGVQKALANFIKNNPQAAYSAGLAGRTYANE